MPQIYNWRMLWQFILQVVLAFEHNLPFERIEEARVLSTRSEKTGSY